MSFKRDGDDKSALSHQRKRRVAELLHEDIDDEELSRLSNGRYICKLCKHGPIFDTLDMFYVHKQGKKHQLSMQYAEQQKQELWDLIQKRKHEEALKARGVVAAQLPEHDQVDKVSETGLKKQRRKPYDRKTILDVNPAHTSGSSCNNTDASSSTNLPGHRHSTIISKSSQNKPSFHGNHFHSNSSLQRNSNTNTPSSFDIDSHSSQIDSDQTYGAKHNTDKFKWKGTAKSTNKDSVMNIKDVQKMVGLSNSEQRNKFYLARKNNFSNSCSEDRQESDMKESTSEGTSDVVSPYQVWEYYKNHKPRNSASIKPANQTECGLDQSSTAVSEAQQNVGKVGKERAEKILHAFGSGWKKDWNGKWIKDVDVEFDSDEEAPDIV